MPAKNAEQFDVQGVKINLSRIIERVEQGEEIVISRAGTPVAKVVPLTHQVNRRGRGSLRGQLVMTSDWDSDEANEATARDLGSASSGRCSKAKASPWSPETRGARNTTSPLPV